jgi:hypothetical protein
MAGMRTLIVDDEPVARQSPPGRAGLELLLGMETIDEAENVKPHF